MGRWTICLDGLDDLDHLGDLDDLGNLGDQFVVASGHDTHCRLSCDRTISKIIVRLGGPDDGTRGFPCGNYNVAERP